MRAYWDDAARRNAAWCVDTSLDFHHPDMEGSSTPVILGYLAEAGRTLEPGGLLALQLVEVKGADAL
jgi:hypothetical protein